MPAPSLEPQDPLSRCLVSELSPRQGRGKFDRLRLRTLELIMLQRYPCSVLFA